MKTKQSPEYFRKWKEAHPDYFRLYARKWRKEHPGLNAERVNAWRKAHPEQSRENQRKWFHAHPDAQRKYRHKWIATNPKKIRERLCERSLKWAKLHPEKNCFQTERRRARLKNAAGWDYTTSQHIQWRWEMWGNKCWMCSKKATATDHVIPLSKSGSHWPANLRPICKFCNSQKGNKIITHSLHNRQS
ncbi:MAG: HNH endonuclease [Smithella sp.]|jgi:hypothetical protein